MLPRCFHGISDWYVTPNKFFAYRICAACGRLLETTVPEFVKEEVRYMTSSNTFESDFTIRDKDFYYKYLYERKRNVPSGPEKTFAPAPPKEKEPTFFTNMREEIDNIDK